MRIKSLNNLKRCFLGLAFVLTISKAFPQDYPRREVDIDAFIQQLFPVQTEDLPYEELYESLFQYYQTPLDLNNVTREELGALFILSDHQIKNFLEYKEKQHGFISIYELQVIPGFDLNTIYKLMPFVKVAVGVQYKSLLKDLLERNKYFLIKYETTLEKKKGNEKGDNQYLGSADKIYGRFRTSNSKHYSIGFTFEKDAGENLKWSPPDNKYGFDYLSYHILFKNKGHFKNLIIGDYQLQFGQGLVLGAGFLPGKGSETVASLRRYNLGIRPYGSVIESGFFRGAAVTYSLKSLDITGFYSNLDEDALVKKDTLTDDHIRSIQISGLHRTSKELLSRKKTNNQTYGGNLTYNFSKTLNLGLTFIATRLQFPLIKKPNKYNQFDFSGDYNHVFSFNYSYIIQNFNLFGEAAQSKSGGIGIVSGAITSLSSKVDLSLIYRNYARDFHSFYGNAFGENTRNANEEGIYLGIKITPIRKIVIASYFDRFYKPWLSYQAYAPSHGNGYLLRVTYLPKKTINFYCQFRYENKEKNRKGEVAGFASLSPYKTSNILMNLDFKPLKSLYLKSRFQHSSVQQEGYFSEGMALSQDVVVEVGKFKVSGRYTLFDTDDYSSRQYGYEKDVLYSFSIPALQGQGIRNYLMLEYNVNRSIDFWIRAARTTYNKIETIGSGSEEIKGNKKTDVKAQIRYKF